MVESGFLAHSSTMTTQATTPIPEPPEAPSSRRLTRSSSDRVIAGVAAGLGRYFSIDPVVVRIAFIVGSFFGGAGLIAYAAAWLLVPSDDGTSRADAAGIAKRLGIAIGMLVLTGVAIVAGFWGAASGGATTVAIIVIATGGVLVLGAFTGGMRWLIVPALALAMSAGAAAAGHNDAPGGPRGRGYRATEARAPRGGHKPGGRRPLPAPRHPQRRPGG